MICVVFVLIVNSSGYVCRARFTGCGKKFGRNWWLVKFSSDKKNCGHIVMGTISIPSYLIGKKVRFKMEVVD